MSKRVLESLILVIVMTIGFQFINIMAVYAEESVLDVNEIIKHCDPIKYSRAQFKEYYNSIKGKTAKGEGTVVKVLPGRKENRVTIYTPVSNPDKGYNVVLYTIQDATSELKPDDRISFKGEVGKISSFEGESVDIHGTYKKSGKK
ncbi:MAG: hypothetical protein WA126_12045 [Thermodesulfovibrionales bacterium]